MQISISNKIDSEAALILDGEPDELLKAVMLLWQEGIIDSEQLQNVNIKLFPAAKPADKLKAAWKSGMLNARDISEVAALLDECEQFLEDRALVSSEPFPLAAYLLAKLKGEKVYEGNFKPFQTFSENEKPKTATQFASIRVMGFGSDNHGTYVSVRITRGDHFRTENLYQESILNFPMPDIS